MPQMPLLLAPGFILMPELTLAPPQQMKDRVCGLSQETRLAAQSWQMGIASAIKGRERTHFPPLTTHNLRVFAETPSARCFSLEEIHRDVWLLKTEKLTEKPLNRKIHNPKICMIKTSSVLMPEYILLFSFEYDILHTHMQPRTF